MGTTVVLVLLAVVVIETLMIGWLLWRVREIINQTMTESEWHHAQATHFGTLVGLLRVLQRGLEQGGLSPEVRKAIYCAADEAIDNYGTKPPFKRKSLISR